MRSAISSDPRSLLEQASAPSGSPLPLPRLLLVFAHPDDEVLAIGARMERLTHSRLLTLTDGAPRDGADAHQHGFPSLGAYRAARQGELGLTLQDAHLPETFLLTARDLPVPDQTAALHLPALTAAVAAAITAFGPAAVLTHPYEGGHPDHDACAFAVHTAVERKVERKVEREAARSGAKATHSPAPLILEAPFYHAGEGASMRTGTFLEAPVSPATIIRELSPQEQANKRRRLACFHSQAETLAQFEVSRELYRIAPRYDFTQPPHPGPLLYERFPWGMTGQRFCDLAIAAQASGSTAQPA